MEFLLSRGSSQFVKNLKCSRSCSTAYKYGSSCYYRHRYGFIIASSSSDNVLSSGIRSLSTSGSSNENQQQQGQGGQQQQQHHQSFVTVPIQPGEWDYERTDPLYKPKYKSKTRMISEEDWANRPMVTFSERYDTFADSYSALSWMDQQDFRNIYELYMNFMIHQNEKFKKTSHEYVMRVIAQRYNITPFRAAAIIQLEDNEQRILQDAEQNGTDISWLASEEANFMDEEIKQAIDEAYEHTGEVKPTRFIEHPRGLASIQEDKRVVGVDDIFDIDKLMENAMLREKDDATMIINNHNYIEDVDDDSINIDCDDDCKKLMHTKNRLIKQKQKGKDEKEGGDDDTTSDAVVSDLPDGVIRKDPTLEKLNFQIQWPKPSIKKQKQRAKRLSKERQKQRWKYVAQTVNIHDQKLAYKEDSKTRKKKTIKHVGYRNNSPKNTLIEDYTTDELLNHDDRNKSSSDTPLRIATYEEIQQVSWKPIRNVQEFTYKDVKKGWLDRTLRNKQGVWGRKPIYQGLQDTIKKATTSTTAEESSSVSEQQEKEAKAAATKEVNDEAATPSSSPPANVDDSDKKD